MRTENEKLAQRIAERLWANADRLLAFLHGNLIGELSLGTIALALKQELDAADRRRAKKSRPKAR
jgi:hypothetical protein